MRVGHQLCALRPVLLGFFVALLASHGAANEVLLERISEAQSRLTAVERQVSRERQSLARELNALEQEVRDLRERTAVARRLEDEKTLSLEQLEQRLDSWRQQQVYQRNLLFRYLQQHGSQSDAASTSTTQQINAVVEASNRSETLFFPVWQVEEVTLTDGTIQQMPVLSIGPVIWFWDAFDTQAGLASRLDDGRLTADLMLRGGDSDSVPGVTGSNEGLLTFDPTLSRALAREQHSESLLDHVKKGGVWVVPILFFALFAAVIAVLKVVQLWRLPEVLRFTPGALATLLTQGESQLGVSVKGMQKRLLDIAQQSPSDSQRDDQLFVQLQHDRHHLERWISAISITAAVSPLLGLLGTVSGMIETFQMMTLFGSGDPEVVSGGIAQALVTTELGLVVAIPALVLNAILSRRAKSYYNNLESFAILLGRGEDAAKPAAEVTAHA